MSNTIRIKRRSGLTGSPESLWGAELAYNEFDHILFIGEGTGGVGGKATTIAPIAGPGAYVTRGVAGTAQSIDGLKTFTSNVAINADSLTSTWSTFNVLPTSTTINIGALATAFNIGATSGTTTVRNNLHVNGTLQISGTTQFTGNVEIFDDLAVNGGDITTTALIASIFDDNATTVNAFGDATTINIGSALGITAIKNSATVAGTLGVTGDTTLTSNLAVNGGNLTSTANTFNILPSLTSINIGNVTGTTTVRNDFVVDGHSTFTANAEFSGSVTVGGDLTVNGNLTTINSTTVSVDDKNLELGATDTPTNTTANGGGITLLGGLDGDKTIIWDSLNANWTSSENWNIASGKTFKINNTDVLSSNTLGSGVIYSSLTTLGTITTGIWHGSTVAAIYGGTGYSSYTKGDILWANSGTTLSQLGIGSYDTDNSVGQILQVGPDNSIRWSNVIDGGTY